MLSDTTARWSTALVEIVDAAIAGGEVDAGDLRAIIVAPTRDFLTLGVWLDTDWTNHPYTPDDDSVAGKIDLAPFLDLVDRVMTEGLVPPSPRYVPHAPIRIAEPKIDQAWRAAWALLHEALTQSAIAAATGGLSSRFSQPVGVFVNTGQNEGTLVAFCHPHGAPLLPLSEQRKEHGYGSAYPHGALTPEGLMIFYPEGEGDSLGSSGPASMRALRFEDLVRAELYDDGVRVLPEDEVFMVRFKPGHTHPEKGGPDDEEVGRALRAHFSERAPHLFPADEERFALPADGRALERFLATFAEDYEKRIAVEKLADRHGVEVIDRLCRTAAIDGALWTSLRPELARRYLAIDRPAEAMEHLGQLTGKDRYQSLEAHALWRLGRHEEVVGLDPKNDRARPFRALSLAALGRVDEALSLLEPHPRDEDCLVARAWILAAQERIDEAQDILRSAFLYGTPSDVLLGLVSEGPLAPVCEERNARKTRLAEARRAAEEMPKIVLRDAPQISRDVPPSAVWAGVPKVESEGPSIRCVLFEGARTLGGDESGQVFELLSDGGRKISCQPFERAVRSLRRAGDHLLASDGTRLALIDPNTDEVTGRIAALDRGDGPVAATGSIVAHGSNDSLHLYRIQDRKLSYWTSFASPNERHFEDVEFLSPTIVAAGTCDDVLIIDVAGEPKLTARIAAEGSIRFRAAGELMVVACNEEVWFVSCRDPSQPIARMRMDGNLMVVPGESDRVWILERGEVLWHLEPSAKRVLGRGQVVDPDGSPYYDAFAFAVQDGVPRVMEASGPSVLSQVEWRRSPEELTRQVGEEMARAEAWIRERMGEWLAMEDRPEIGFVRAVCYESGIRLECGGPFSAPSLVTLQEGVGDLFHFAEEDAAEEGEAAHAEALQRAAQMHRHFGRTARLTAIMRDLRSLLERGPRMSRLVHVAVRDAVDNVWTILDVVKTDGVAPRRAVAEPKKTRTVRDRLTSPTWYREVDALKARAQRDPEVRREVLKLLVEERLPGAASIAVDLAEIDPEGTRSAWLATAKDDPELALPGLIQHASHPDVRSALESLADDERWSVALPARRALGRLEEERSLELIKQALADEHEQPPFETLSLLSDRALASLSDQLLATYERLANWNEYVANELLIPLARSGVETLPKRAIDAAAKQRKTEQLFDQGIDFGDHAPESAVTALRHVIARRIEKKLAHADQGGALWPEEIEPEPYQTSWNRFFEIAWPRWTEAGLLDALHQRLSAPLESEADRKLAVQVLYQYLLRGDLRAEALGARLKEGPYEGKTLEKVTQMARLGRLQFGWSLLKEERYREARAVANAALADGPDEGQVLFFDARLAWLEKNDPNEALKRIPAALERAKDAPGLGRLYNLYGAALDALGRYEESISWFEKAMGADPSQAAMFTANIAEAYWKLGDKAKARAMAEKAAVRGSNAPILATILASAADP